MWLLGGKTGYNPGDASKQVEQEVTLEADHDHQEIGFDGAIAAQPSSNVPIPTNRDNINLLTIGVAIPRPPTC